MSRLEESNAWQSWGGADSSIRLRDLWCLRQDVVGMWALSTLAMATLAPWDTVEEKIGQMSLRGLPAQDLALYGAGDERKIEPGRFRVWIGWNGQEELAGDFEVLARP